MKSFLPYTVSNLKKSQWWGISYCSTKSTSSQIIGGNKRTCRYIRCSWWGKLKSRSDVPVITGSILICRSELLPLVIVIYGKQVWLQDRNFLGQLWTLLWRRAEWKTVTIRRKTRRPRSARKDWIYSSNKGIVLILHW